MDPKSLREKADAFRKKETEKVMDQIFPVLKSAAEIGHYVFKIDSKNISVHLHIRELVLERLREMGFKVAECEDDSFIINW